MTSEIERYPNDGRAPEAPFAYRLRHVTGGGVVLQGAHRRPDLSTDEQSAVEWRDIPTVLEMDMVAP